jgi:hypothetical protein
MSIFRTPKVQQPTVLKSGIVDFHKPAMYSQSLRDELSKPVKNQMRKIEPLQIPRAPSEVIEDKVQIRKDAVHIGKFTVGGVAVALIGVKIDPSIGGLGLVATAVGLLTEAKEGVRYLLLNREMNRIPQQRNAIAKAELAGAQRDRIAKITTNL